MCNPSDKNVEKTLWSKGVMPAFGSFRSPKIPQSPGLAAVTAAA